jgi:ribulose-phosphate 3-epimerase
MTATPRRTLQIVPSLLAADLSRLGEQLQAAAKAGVTWVSVDVMDGHFVPNLSFGPDFVRMVKKIDPRMTVDAHLMVSTPETVVPYFIEAGADFVTFHWEACEDASSLLKRIRESGAKAGLAIKPKTAVEPLLERLGMIDLALVMTVEPGFGGAKFLGDMMPKVAALRHAIDAKNLSTWIQVDGGVNANTISQAAAAGADSLVAGTAVFGAKDVTAAVKDLRERAEKAISKKH